MAREFGKVTRISVVLTVLIALVMLATPVLQIGGKGVSPVGNAAAANGSRLFNVGIVGYTGAVATLNPFTYTMSAEFDTFSPCYSTMLSYDINANRVGDLATSWTTSPDGLTWNFKLARNAYFIDPAAPTSTAHQVTAKDVMWTFWEINNDSKNHLSSYFLTGSVGIINAMWTGVDQFDFYLQLKGPYAPFLGAMTAIPIVPEYIWGHLTNGKTPTTYSNLPPIGSGPFYYGLAGMPTTVGILKRNPIWFNEANRGWQIHVDTLQYKNEMSTATAWTELTMTPPLIDTYLNVDPTQYLNNVAGGQTPGIIGWAQSTGFVFEYQLNQLSNAQRTALGMHTGSNNQLLRDPTVKLAMAMCVDKQTFINVVVQGLGTVADSLVPDVNPWHYTYPNPVQYNPVAARALLMAAGWDHDSAGNPATSSTVPLCKYGAANHTAYQPLSFRMLTLNTEAYWDVGARKLVEWAGLGGVQLIESLVSTNQANTAWYAGNYDTWLWDWVFTPTSDPSTDCLQVDTSMAIGTWSGSWWNNASFDALYNRSLVAMDPTARRQLTNEMQASIYEDHNDQLIAYTKYLYAANTYNWYGPSYGNWTQHWTLMPDQCYPWLYTQLSPTSNHAPTITGLSSTFQGVVNSPISVFGSAVDDASTLKYQWYWGDGTVSGWQTSPTQSHTYTADGVYTAYFGAQEQGTADGFVSSGTTVITVVNPSNSAPTISSITMTPSSGINSGTNVLFTAVANDADGDTLSYNWNFGDTYTGTGVSIHHQFTTVGSYTVTLSVDDGHPGLGRPATMTKAVSVALNHPPAISIQGSQTAIWKAVTFFNASASDADGDAMRFTWVWGDGSTLVTTTPLSVTHIYNQKFTVTMHVYADDLTGLPGHNVSAADVITVQTTSSPPYGLTFAVNKTSIWVSQSVTFTATAKDPVGDALRFTINCGDGSYIVVDMPSTLPDAVVTVTASHTYWSAGSMSASLYVFDGGTNTSGTSTVGVTVTLNGLPVVTPLSNKNANAGSSVSFSVIAFDPEGATLKYTWDFGDGTGPLKLTATPTHTYAKAGMYPFTVYVDDQTGLAGHNVSSSATISVAFNLNLALGWNFVTVPVIGFGYKASTLGLAVGDLVASWNSSTQTYDHTYIKGISPIAADFPIVQNAGYWVWVGVAKVLHLYGSVAAGGQSNIFLVPGSGWVAVGFESLNTTRHASDIVAMYSGAGAVTLVATYNAVTGTYTSYIAGIPVNNFLLVPGQGYWCWATGSGVLAYVP